MILLCRGWQVLLYGVSHNFKRSQRTKNRGVGGIPAFGVSHKQVIRAKDLQADFKDLLVHLKSFWVFCLLLVHDCNVIFGVGRKRVLAAKDLLLDCKHLAIQLQSLIMLALLIVCECNAFLSHGCAQVVQAVDFDLDLKRLVIVFQCLWILVLVMKHQANAAQQRKSHRKEEHAEVAGILPVVGLGYVRVLQAECFFLNLKHILPCCERIIILALIIVHCTDAAKKHKHWAKK